MTILLSFSNKGKLELFDENILNHIKSFLSKTPNENFIQIHKQMELFNYKPCKKSNYYIPLQFWFGRDNGLAIPLVAVDSRCIQNYKQKMNHDNYKQKIKQDNYKLKNKQFRNKRK